MRITNINGAVIVPAGRVFVRSGRDGHDRDFEMVVLEDCCAEHSAQEHANSIGSLQRFSQLMTSNDPWLAPA